MQFTIIKKFNTAGVPEFETVTGDPVMIDGRHCFTRTVTKFIYSRNTKLWAVTDGETGTNIGEHKDRDQAIAYALFNLQSNPGAVAMFIEAMKGKINFPLNKKPA